MHGAENILKELAIVLGTAALTTILFQRLRQPVVLGHILAGLLIGPHIPVPLVADKDLVHTLSELGVILLMYSIGLEFSLRRLVRVGPGAGLIALIEISLMLWLGCVAGQLFGWPLKERLFTGAIVAISSTMIVAKVFAECRVAQRITDLCFGVLVFEDLVAILLLATLTALGGGQGVSARALLGAASQLLAFLAGLLVLGLLLVPRAIRAVARLGNQETLLLASIGLCFGLSLLAQRLGYSVALGAFLAGALSAESGEGARIEPLVLPIRDLFAAVFFVSVGMLLDPRLVLLHWKVVVALTLLVVLGKLAGVSIGAFLTGNGIRSSIQAGMSLAQIGEFSFILAGVGLKVGATREFLFPVAVAVSVLTSFGTPYLVRAAPALARHIDNRLPRALQTFVTLYGSWVEGLRSAPRRRGAGFSIRRLVRLLILDSLLLLGLVIGTSLFANRLTRYIEGLGAGPALAEVLVVAGALVLSLPFCIGILRLTHRLAVELAARAIPVQKGKADLGGAPRRALNFTLQLTILLLMGIPGLALSQPFLPSFAGALLLAIGLCLVGAAIWSSITNLHGHVRAGAEMIMEALAAQSASAPREPGGAHIMSQVGTLLPGLGTLSAVQVETGSPAVGRTLGWLDVHGRTGATVLAIQRGREGVVVPAPEESLREGDVLVLAGSEEASEAARHLLTASGAPSG